MNLSLTSGQEMLRRAAREFLDANCPSTLVRQVEESGAAYAGDLWRSMAALGWLGLPLPAEHGGEGGDVVDLLVLAEELGRAMAPAPWRESTVACGALLACGGSEAQRAEFLPRLASGDTIMTLALAEGPGATDLGGLATVLEPADDGVYRVTGVKRFVPYAASADVLVCVARPVRGPGLAAALVDAGAPGVTVRPQASVAGFPQAVVEFAGVPVAADRVIAGAGAAVVSALDLTTLALCGEMVGRAQKILEMVVDYAKTRVQFGRPIGAFQAIQHQCADLRVAVDVARLLAFRAACDLRDGLAEAPEEIAAAKLAADRASRISTVTGHGVYAGIAYTVEHDMQLYSARNRLAEAQGDGLHPVERVARAMGL